MPRKEASMKYVIVGKNMEVTQSLKDAVTQKLDKLDKFFSPDTEVHVTLQVNRDRHKIEVTIPVRDNIIRSEQVSNDMYVSIDLVEEVIERQLKKYKSKLIKRHQEAAAFKREYVERSYYDEEDIRIVRKKQFDLKPMYPDDACVQMELLGHNFFVFINAEEYGKTRDQLYFEMREQGVLGRRYFFPLISTFSTYRGLPSAAPDNLPVATRIANEVICLPMHHQLTDEDIERTLNCILK